MTKTNLKSATHFESNEQSWVHEHSIKHRMQVQSVQLGVTKYKKVTDDKTVKCCVSFENAFFNPKVTFSILFCLFAVLVPGSKKTSVQIDILKVNVNLVEDFSFCV